MRSFLLLVACLICPPKHLAAAEVVDYTRDIKPLLKQHCFPCHGALKQKAKLRLDAGPLIHQGGRSGPAVRGGSANASVLIERVTAPDESTRMPPEGKPLTHKQVALLRAWIDQGAKFPPSDKAEEDPKKHWAFQAPVRPQVPRVQRTEWVRNPVDAFVAGEHDKQGLQPLHAADKPVLLRRIYLDLVGLPPTRAELHAFLADNSVDAYEKVVDRLLASPGYGERWGRHWMDVWRYSDWYGRRSVPDVMNSYPRIWRWRDWIVRSLNQDKGYDRMIVEMLAADETAPDDDENIVATGFIVRNWYKWNYNSWMKDLVEHTGKAFLGLTLNCCHCHDHKYDPITQEEYFKFRAFFEPLELRHDRVAGEPDPGPFKKYVYAKSYGPIASGLIRVFDEKLDAKTLMYQGGDERNKFEGRAPVDPGAPGALGGDRLKVEPVQLPLHAQYPGLRPFVQEEERSKRKQELTAARLGLATALEKLAAAHREVAAGETSNPPRPPGQSAVLDAQSEVQLGEARLAIAEGELHSLVARIAADNSKYKKMPGNVEELARAAGRAERSATLCVAKDKLLRAEQSLAKARRILESAAAGKAKETAAAAVPKAEQQLASAKTGVSNAEKALGPESTQYTPLSPLYPATSTGRRRALAQWITGRDNPLTARVAVNHIWARHFGRPLVATTFNLGRNGKPPSHPELLDWLAVELMDNAWSMKHLHRLIVTSNAYRMRSSGTTSNDTNLARDPDNRFLWHFEPVRVQAEVVRDSVLHAAGGLDHTLGGPEIDHAKGLVTPRRSIYFSHHGESKMEFLDLFDAASATECYERTSSILPQQALALTNSELTHLQASSLARQLWEAMSSGGDQAFVKAAFEQVLARPPTAQEIEASVRFLQRQTSLFSAPGSEGRPADPAARARESLVQALFSHNDFVTIR